jgi:hypothetical protein
MRLLTVLAVIAAGNSVIVPGATAAVSTSAAAKTDVQCLVLNMAAVGNTKDAAVKQAGTVGIMYFLGKLRVEAPALDLTAAVEQEVNALQGNPKAPEIGTACDSEIQQRGKDLIDLGAKLEKDGQSSSSS